jgi:hypothetical protein
MVRQVREEQTKITAMPDRFRGLFLLAVGPIFILSAGCSSQSRAGPTESQAGLPPGYSWSERGDKIQILQPREFQAGRWAEVELAIMINGQPLRTGEEIVLGVPFGFPPPVLDNPAAEGYLTVSGPAGVKLAAEKKKWEHFVWVRVAEGMINPGEEITVRYGDRSAGSPGVRPFPQAQAAAFWPVFRESERPALSRGSTMIPVKPGPIAGLRVHLPAIARPGEKVRLRVVAQDAYGNRPDISGRVIIVNRAAVRGSPDFMRLEKGQGTAEFPAPSAGIVRLVLREKTTGVEGISNPMEIAGSAEKLWFGDLHIHTELSYDAGGAIGEMYEYARDIAGLDFAAASDHQAAIRGVAAGTNHHGSNPCWRFESMPERWAAAVASAKRCNDPGRFVTFAGFEFAPNGFNGHRNVYWLDDSPPMIETEYPGENRFSPATFQRLIREQRLLVIPHHPAIEWKAGVWDRGEEITYGDLPDEAQPVVEIYSKHGTSEYLNNERPLRGQVIGHFISDFLEQGHRFGLIGGSDTHNGNPGSPLREGPYSTLRFRAGLAAVWADELTRESVWRAIFARRTYATTGPKILLRFSVGDLRMGEEGTILGARRVCVEAHGEEPLILIEIVKNGTVIGRWDPLRPLLDKTFEYDDPAGAERDVDYYYARVRQHDGERAWSSPVWVRRQP